jgi:TolB-like protein/class 3 adenylate cyclase/Tfp pilus assembly protein PilF
MTLETQRRLSAILSADVAGYSRLMADDEEATVRTLVAYREQIGALVREHRGRVVDAPGDNLLAEFSTASEAVETAVEIQRVIGARNAALDEGRRMEFRIGVHLGEVRVEGDRIYGDGVNIAARLEGLAERGGICVSAAVRDQVARRLGLDFEDVGEQSVKNLPDPVHVYRVLERVAGVARGMPAGDRGAGATPTRQSAADAARSRWRSARSAVVASAVAIVALVGAGLVYRGVRPSHSPADSPPPTSASGPPLTAIAVLPFDDLSPGGDHAWLANGMAEELIEMLSRSEALQVVARTSATVAKEGGADIAAIGELLNVGSVVEGSVRRADEQLRVTVQLIRVADGYHLWSGRYDRTLDDVFAIQQEIGREVAEALRAELGIADTFSWLSRARYLPRDVRAYELVKKGVDLDPLAFDEASLRQAIDYFSKALEIDPDYGQAHAQLAWSLYNSWVWRFDRREQTRELARTTARRALELEATNGSAHNLLAYLSSEERDWKNAKARWEKALEAEPGHGSLRSGYGLLLLSLGSLEQAAVQMQRGVDLDPLYGFAHGGLGNVLVAQRNYPAAIASFERGAELGDLPSLGELPFAYHLNGMDRKARDAWVRIATIRYRTPEIERVLGEAFDERGIEGAAEAFLDEAVSRVELSCLAIPWWTARVLALIGDADRMFACLDQTIEEHRLERLAKVHPIYDPYRDDPRFEAYLRRLNLAE